MIAVYFPPAEQMEPERAWFKTFFQSYNGRGQKVKIAEHGLVFTYPFGTPQIDVLIAFGEDLQTTYARIYNAWRSNLIPRSPTMVIAGKNLEVDGSRITEEQIQYYRRHNIYILDWQNGREKIAAQIRELIRTKASS